jgi:Flp pilus assembly protein TadD
MNRRFGRYGPGLVAVVLGLPGFAGCQHGQPVPQPVNPLAAFGESTPKLNARQVADVQLAVGHSLEMQGQPAAAMAKYREAVKQDPNRADACLRLAILYDQEGKFHESLDMYRQALARMPGNPDIYCNMGYSLYLQQQYADAEMNFRQAIALAPAHQRAHNNLGLVLAHTNRHEEALAEFTKAGLPEADARVNLAFVLTLESNWPEARKQYEAALAADDTSTAAKKGLQELEMLTAKMASRHARSQRDNLTDLAEMNPLQRVSFTSPGAESLPAPKKEEMGRTP